MVLEQIFHKNCFLTSFRLEVFFSCLWDFLQGMLFQLSFVTFFPSKIGPSRDPDYIISFACGNTRGELVCKSHGALEKL